VPTYITSVTYPEEKYQTRKLTVRRRNIYYFKKSDPKIRQASEREP
jgi:hypothetical protein